MHWLSHVWYTRWWSSDLGNGPENVQWWALAALGVSFFIPAIRNYFKRMEAKLDHIITNHPDIPAIELEFKKWEHWVVTLFKRIFKRKASS